MQIKIYVNGHTEHIDVKDIYDPFPEPVRVEHSSYSNNTKQEEKEEDSQKLQSV